MSTARDPNVTWLNRLRWLAIAGQIALIGATSAFTSVHLPLASLGVVIAMEIVFVGFAEWGARRGLLASQRAIVGTLIVDVLVLTVLLYLSGGPENPFNFLYLVHVTLALVAVGEGAAWGLLALSAVLSGGLFFWHTPLHVHGADAHSTMSLHMQGMWVGLIAAGASVVWFASRLSRALRTRDAELALARERATAAERMAALATLAAGAAHELNTPLSTIAVASRELELSAEELGDAGRELLTDAQLIRVEVKRCRAILEQLSADAGQAAASTTDAVTVAHLLSGFDVPVDIADGLAERVVHVPLRSLRRAFAAAIDNAAATESEVLLSARQDDEALVVEVRDDGPGMSPEVLARAFEPFFTTRPAGKGMGLGLFLARSVTEAMGGTVEIASSQAAGTTVTFRLPIQRDTSPA